MGFDDRSRILWGDAGAELLAAARVCVLGLGGVGGACAVDLVRAGVGCLVVVDFDDVQESNLNRLAYGRLDDVGKPKVAAFADAARAVNPAVRIEAVDELVRGSDAASMIPGGCAFYVDAIDTLNSKVNVITALCGLGLPFASSMGMAGRMRPELIRVGRMDGTSGCPLAAKVRQRLRRIGAREDFTVVWSDERPVKPAFPADGSVPGAMGPVGRVRSIQGSSPFVPQAAGHILASLAVRALLGLPWRASVPGGRCP
ncbi:MAG: ThiF family adenylyltransferase [Spirochaetes bacterium]|nr:ThiF family adenylyltransferase [Spirochaetota bacterium]